MSSIKDVALRAGVSTATVSNVINSTRYVAPELCERVHKAIEELHYAPSPIARGMKGYSSHIIGVIISCYDQLFFPQVINGIENIAHENGFHIVVQYTNYNLAVEKACIQFLLNTNISGILLNSVAPADNTEYFKWVSNLSIGGRHVPVVSLERDLTFFSIDSVCIDDVYGAVIATKHLISQGCRNICHIAGPSNFAISTDRINGFERVMKESGLEYTILSSDFKPIGGYESIRSLLKSGKTFDGVFCASDAIAIGALKALREYHIPCPEEVKVIGFDNSYLASLIRPSLSTIHVPQIGIGQEATKQLINRITLMTDTPALMTEIAIRIIPRRSTNPNCNDEWELEL